MPMMQATAPKVMICLVCMGTEYLRPNSLQVPLLLLFGTAARRYDLASALRLILPLGVRGSASTNRISRGHL
jgi:hypothetical protein